MGKTSIDKSHILPAVLRQDLCSFIQRSFQTISPGSEYLYNWHIEAIAHALTKCHQGKIKRLIITLPPRNLKSIAASVAFPAWVLGHDPTRRIIGVSYSQDLATKHAMDTRTVMLSDWYQNCFPNSRLHPEKNSRAEFMTSEQGYRFSTSVGGTLTGRGGNLIIIDDPQKAEEVMSDTKREGVKEWFRSTLLSRLDNKQKDCIILIQQRLHDDDLAGHLLEHGGWEHLNLPAIAEGVELIPISDTAVHQRQPGDLLHPERESIVVLEGMKESLGSYAYAAQYQQQPAPLGGGLIKWTWFPFYDQPPESKTTDRIIQSWDTACKDGSMHDYSVCTTWRIVGDNYYLLHLWRDRLEYPDLKRRIIVLAQQWKAEGVIIEDKGAGIQLIQDLRRDHNELNIYDFLPKESKAERVMAITPKIEGQQVWLPLEAHWMADFQREVVTFPKGKHDDMVDSVTQFLLWARNHAKRHPFFIAAFGPPLEELFYDYYPGNPDYLEYETIKKFSE
ncbi:MAG: phage terminase large subunit [Candidatus Thiodiazotropha taylori]|nr:phage terminase large subunit [Candidatus Thiodiazotropha taylori]